MHPACAVSAPLTCATARHGTAQRRQHPAEHAATDARRHKAGRRSPAEAAAATSCSAVRVRGSLRRAAQRTHRVKGQHLVHRRSAEHHLIIDRHAAPHEPRVAALQEGECGHEANTTLSECRSCSARVCGLGWRRCDGQAAASSRRACPACGTTARRRSLQCRSTAAACSRVFGLSATRAAPSYFPIQSLRSPGSGG